MTTTVQYSLVTVTQLDMDQSTGDNLDLKMGTIGIIPTEQRGLHFGEIVKMLGIIVTCQAKIFLRSSINTEGKLLDLNLVHYLNSLLLTCVRL